MKTPEELLEQWTSDSIHFIGRYNSDSPSVWTRYELNFLAARLRNKDTWCFDQMTEERFKLMIDSFPASDIESFHKARLGGPEITAQYLAQFDSMIELAQYFRDKGWVGPLSYIGLPSSVDP